MQYSSRVYSLAAGGCFAAAWAVFGDALLLHSIHAIEPGITLAHWIPSFLATLAFMLLVCAPVRYFDMQYAMNVWYVSCAHCWIFSSFLLFFLAMTTGVFLMEAMRSSAESQYAYLTAETLNISDVDIDDITGEAYHLRVGIAIVANTILLFASAGLWLTGQLPTDQHT